MDGLKTWLVSVAAAALVASIAAALSPEGTPKKLAKFSGGLLLVLALLSPLRTLDDRALADFATKYMFPAVETAKGQQYEDPELVKSIIEQESAAYISDKAAALGVAASQVTVTCHITEEGFPALEQVTVRGSGEESAWSALSKAITADFSLEKEAQRFERTDVP